MAAVASSSSIQCDAAQQFITGIPARTACFRLEGIKPAHGRIERRAEHGTRLVAAAQHRQSRKRALDLGGQRLARARCRCRLLDIRTSS
jgi:hypothetical protein